MSVVIPARGTRGGTFPRLPGGLSEFFNDLAFRIFRNRLFQGSHVLALSTIGARTGKRRRTTVMYFPNGDDAWLIVASAGGAAKHPAWFFNLARNPDDVWVEVGNRTLRVIPESLSGEERATAWQRIVAQSPIFGGYQTKTDREIPVVRLRPA